MNATGQGDAPAATVERALIELLTIERELLELEYVRRADALERVGEAIRRLGEPAGAEGLLDRAAAELGAGSDFLRVLISEVADGRMRPLTIWSAHDRPAADRALTALTASPIALDYPLYEHDVARGGGPQIVTVAAAGGRTPPALARGLGWTSYAVAAITIGAETIGLVHADRPDRAPAGQTRGASVAAVGCAGRALDALDAEVAGRYAAGLAGVFERAVLRHTLGLHRGELAAAAQWIGGRLHRLGDDGPGVAGGGAPAATGGEPAMREALTRRELEVLRLLTRGQTNRAIANALVVREGTVKYHVKNILRKLDATSRADAVARFLRSGAAAP